MPLTFTLIFNKTFYKLINIIYADFICANILIGYKMTYFVHKLFTIVDNFS